MKVSYKYVLLIVLGIPFYNRANHLPVRPDQLMIRHLGTGAHYYVHYLTDFKGNGYVLKQKNNIFSNQNKALQAIREALGTYIANECHIPGQRVWIIPARLPFVGKSFENEISTLHLEVPGKMIKDHPRWSHLDIRQRKENKKVIAGIQKHIIQHMSNDADLSALVAVDSVIGNCGRHNKNFFYDDATQKFYFIDMGGCFKSDHVLPSINNIEKMIADVRLTFSKKELRSLIIYRNTVHYIATTLPPELIKEKLEFFMDQAELDESTKHYVRASITKCLMRSYSAMPRLLLILDTLIDQKSPHSRYLLEDNTYEN